MIKMKLSTVLLSSAALLVAGAAYAADLPAKKAAPAAAPTGCAAFGAGYIAIPGGDTCLKISGYVESDNRYTSPVTRPGTAPYTIGGAFGLGIDTASQSEMGAVKSQILLETGSDFATLGTTFANVSVGGFTAGKADGLLDWGLGYSATGLQANGKTTQLQYSASLGAGTTLSVAATTAESTTGITGSTAAGASARPDLIAALNTKVGSMSFNVGAASHEADGSTSGSVQGYAIVGNASFDAGVAKFTAYAAYANAAAYYIGAGSHLDDVSSTGTNQSSGSNYEFQVDVPVGKNDSIGLTADSINATAGTAKYVASDVGVSVKHTIAKGLWVRPELYAATSDTGSGQTTSQGLYVRIERDF